MYLLSPMPGLLRSIAVSEGQSLESGAELCVVEAMKMENILRASRPVKIAHLRARPGDILTVGQVILEYATEEIDTNGDGLVGPQELATHQAEHRAQMLQRMPQK